MFRAGDRLPVGVEAPRGWSERPRALGREPPRVVTGGTLVDRGHSLEFPADWGNKGVPPEQIVESLLLPLELPVEHVLATRGGPFDRAALERALSGPHERLEQVLNRVKGEQA